MPRYPDYDEDDEETNRILSLLPLHANRYRIEIKALSATEFYWHLYDRDNGERVNGGLSDNWWAAHRDARQASYANWIGRDRDDQERGL